MYYTVFFFAARPFGWLLAVFHSRSPSSKHKFSPLSLLFTLLLLCQLHSFEWMALVSTLLRLTVGLQNTRACMSTQSKIPIHKIHSNIHDTCVDGLQVAAVEFIQSFLVHISCEIVFILLYVIRSTTYTHRVCAVCFMLHTLHIARCSLLNSI